METPPDIGAGPDYYPVPGSESDDTQSFASHSDGNDNIPCIIYTSDDSADANQPVLNYSDDFNLIAHSVNQQMFDEISQQFLLESEQTSPQMSPQPADHFISHPLSSVQFESENPLKDNAFINQNSLFVDSAIEGSTGLVHSTSSSSVGTESSPDVNPLLSQYEPLPFYPEDDSSFPGVINFDVLQEDPIKTRVLTNCKRWYVGNVHIDSDYKDLFFVRWDWTKIRQIFSIIHGSFLIGLLFVGIALLVRMPRGSQCDPARQWWQGSVAYHIFVPSFQDSNGDGIGDIKGIISRLDYLSNLGVKVVRLAPIYETESAFDVPFSPINYTSVMSSLGDIDDLHLLSLLLHEREMFLMLDLPLSSDSKLGLPTLNSKTNTRRPFSSQPSINLYEDVPTVLSNWIRLGVDGFVFEDLDKLAHEDLETADLLSAMASWRHTLDNAKSGRQNRRIMVVPLNFIKKIESIVHQEDVKEVLSLVDMIDAQMGISPSAKEIGSLIHEVTQWSNQPSHPSISWSLGGVGLPRLFEQLPSLDASAISTFPINTIGPLILQLYLPGSVTLYYGDEIALCHPEEAHLQDFGWASLMLWSSGSKNGGFTSGEPWIPPSKNWKVKNVAALSHHLEPLRVMIKTAQNEVPMYATSICSVENEQKPKPNYQVRLAEENLLILERFYPRRNSYAVIINLGSQREEKDLSDFYYGCDVLASSHGKNGYVLFSNITLLPGEALACILEE